MIEIEGVKIGHDEPCRFVAEISNNHNGDQARCFRLIEAAVTAGADFVKFQAYTPDELVQLRGDGRAPEPWGSQGHTMRSLYEMAETPHEWLPGAFEMVRALGAVPFASVFGYESLALLESIRCPAYKIAALDVDRDVPLWDEVADIGKPVIASIREWHVDYDWIDLHLLCPEGYPQHFTKLDELEMKGFAQKYDGFSYHGTDPNVPAYAVGQGARIIECHFQLAGEPSELEANVSLDENQFTALVTVTRNAEEIFDRA